MMKKSPLPNIVICFLVFFAGLSPYSSVSQASTLQLPTSIIGSYVKDWPNLDPIYDIDDGDRTTMDYFFEWELFTRDSSNNKVYGITNSVETWMPLETSDFPSFFPAPGAYTIELRLTTAHQAGGLPNCGPHTICFDYSLESTIDTVSDYMNVTLNSVPVPASVWLFGSGLLGLVGIARRKKAA